MHKKEFTSFDVAAVVRELREAILDSRVNNVYQLDAKTVLLKLHKANQPALALVLEAGRRLHLSSYALEKPSTPPAFCMALRKYLRNSMLKNAKQYEFERVVVFSFSTSTNEGEIKLVVELFGDGNVVLVNENEVILQALSYKRMRHRDIMRGEPFAFAPPSGKNPMMISRRELCEGLKEFGDLAVVRAVVRFLGVGGVYAEEVLLRSGIDKNRSCGTLDDVAVNAIFENLNALLSRVASDKLEPNVVINETDTFADVLPLRLELYATFKQQAYATFNEALDEFYTRVKAIEKATAGVEVDELETEAERLKRMIESQAKTVAEAENKAERDRRIGDTIYANIVEFQTMLDRFSMAKQTGKNWHELVAEVLAEKEAGLKPSPFFESFDTKNLMINVCVDGLQFGLEVRRSLFENAAVFYERGKHARQKLEGAKAALEDSRKKLGEVEAKIRITGELEQDKPAEAIEELVKRKIKSKEWFEKFRWFVSSDGFLVVAGKDATSNEVLVKKHTEPDDIVFHADVLGAPFVVIKTEGKAVTEECLRQAGEFAAAFSRGWREGFASVDVYWVKPQQLSKGGPSGESVGHGAFVVRGERNWLRGTPLKLAIGVAFKEGRKFTGGPIDAVKAKTDAYVSVVPGDASGKELLRHVLKALSLKLPKDLQAEVLKASVEEIREFIPFGRARILESAHARELNKAQRQKTDISD